MIKHNVFERLIRYHLKNWKNVKKYSLRFWVKDGQLYGDFAVEKHSNTRFFQIH